MTFLQLDHRYDDVIERVRHVTTALAPFSVDADNSNTIYAPVADIIRNSGLMSLMIPSSHGGDDLALDPVAICLVR